MIDVQNVVVGLIVETISEVVSIEEEDILPPPNVSKANAQAKFIRGIGKIAHASHSQQKHPLPSSTPASGLWSPPLS